MNSSLSMQDWINAMADATGELATSTLGFEGCSIRETGSVYPDGMAGSLLSLTNTQDSIQVGILSTPEGCRNLAKSMLGMGPEEDLTDGDMADAVSEAINIVAGGVKRRLSGDSPLQLGLPLFINGRIEPGDRQEPMFAKAMVGPIEICLVVLREK